MAAILVGHDPFVPDDGEGTVAAGAREQPATAHNSAVKTCVRTPLIAPRYQSVTDVTRRQLGRHRSHASRLHGT
jgi:hypothetical protein